MALTRTVSAEASSPAVPPRRRFIPALPTLWPEHLSPLAADRAPPFPFGAPRVTPFYFARNAVFHAVRLLGLAGREVLVPAYHHGVEIAALAAAGAIPRFVRVDGRMRLDLDHLASEAGPRAGAIYVIHYAGFPQPMDPIRAVARKLGVPVIEDCALALFSAEGSRPVGTTGEVSIFCFYKTLPVPNGGALVVNVEGLASAGPRPESAPVVSTLSHAAGSLLANAAFRLGSAGEAIRSGLRAVVQAARSASGLRPVSTGTSTFDPSAVRLGMSGLSARIARRVDAAALVAARRRNYFLLLAGLRDRAPPLLPELPQGVCPLFYPLLCDDKATVKTRLAARGIETVDFWRTGHPLCPVERFPEVATLRRRVLELPVHQDLSPEDMAFLARCTREALG
jgi:dTDP-4-amino-4,6-dideoxygalactose transaminase